MFYSLLLLLAACKGNEEDINSDLIRNPHSASGEQTDELPAIKFNTERIELGDITQGEKITRRFEFTNTGTADLLITNIAASCHCTVANDWPTEPVKPGEGGSFSVTFDSENQEGQQVKKVTVTANTNPATHVVAIAGNVIVPGKNKP